MNTTSPSTPSPSTPSSDDLLVLQASKIGHEHGTSSATWVEVDEGNAAAILRAIEDCDPAVCDLFPSADLGGEWADSYTRRDLGADLDLDEEDEDSMWALNAACDAYLEGFDRGVEDEVTRACVELLEVDEGFRPEDPTNTFGRSKGMHADDV